LVRIFTAVSCGDSVVNTNAGEVCDDGVNNGTGPSFCAIDCSAFIP
jgi:hypothetical protein